MLIEKLESQLKAEDLIKPELNGNLAADWMAFTPVYDLLEAARGPLRERGAPFKLLEFGFSCVVSWQIDWDASLAKRGKDADDNVETRAVILQLPGRWSISFLN